MGGPEIVKWSTDNNVVSQDKNKQTKKRKEKHCVILHEGLTKSKGNGLTSYLVPRAFP